MVVVKRKENRVDQSVGRASVRDTLGHARDANRVHKGSQEVALQAHIHLLGEKTNWQYCIGY